MNNNNANPCSVAQFLYPTTEDRGENTTQLGYTPAVTPNSEYPQELELFDPFFNVPELSSIPLLQELDSSVPMWGAPHASETNLFEGLPQQPHYTSFSDIDYPSMAQNPYTHIQPCADVNVANLPSATAHEALQVGNNSWLEDLERMHNEFEKSKAAVTEKLEEAPEPREASIALPTVLKAISKPKYEVKRKRRPKTGDKSKLKIPCENCRVLIANGVNMARHLHNVHRGDPMFFCKHEGCFANFTSERGYKHHLRLIHGKMPVRHGSSSGPFHCGFCDYNSKQKSNLTRHERLKHTEGKAGATFKCPFCPHVSLCKANLSIHTMKCNSRKRAAQPSSSTRPAKRRRIENNPTENMATPVVVSSYISVREAPTHRAIQPVEVSVSVKKAEKGQPDAKPDSDVESSSGFNSVCTEDLADAKREQDASMLGLPRSWDPPQGIDLHQLETPPWEIAFTEPTAHPMQ